MKARLADILLAIAIGAVLGILLSDWAADSGLAQVRGESGK